MNLIKSAIKQKQIQSGKSIRSIARDLDINPVTLNSFFLSDKGTTKTASLLLNYFDLSIVEIMKIEESKEQ